MKPTNCKVTIATLQTALSEAVARAEDAVSQIQTEALEQERTTNASLRDSLERIKTEFSLLEDRSKSEITDLRERLEREQLSTRTTIADMTAEINVLPNLHDGLIVDSGVEVGGIKIAGRGIFYFDEFLCTGEIVKTD